MDKVILNNLEAFANYAGNYFSKNPNLILDSLKKYLTTDSLAFNFLHEVNNFYYTLLVPTERKGGAWNDVLFKQIDIATGELIWQIQCPPGDIHKWLKQDGFIPIISDKLYKHPRQQPLNFKYQDSPAFTSSFIDLPDMTGRKYKDFADAFEKNFIITKQFQFSDSIPAGSIISTNKVGRLQTGTALTVIISSGTNATNTPTGGQNGTSQYKPSPGALEPIQAGFGSIFNNINPLLLLGIGAIIFISARH